MSHDIVSFDPGASGCMIVNGTEIHLDNLGDPAVSVDVMLAAMAIARQNDSAIVFAEEVGGRPGNGVARNWAFAYGVGRLHAIIECVWKDTQWVFVRPQVWQSDLDCLTGGNKNVTKAKAMELFPGRKITHRNADALLIDYWGRNIHGTKIL